jgi:hypothetical protein
MERTPHIERSQVTTAVIQPAPTPTAVAPVQIPAVRPPAPAPKAPVCALKPSTTRIAQTSLTTFGFGSQKAADNPPAASSHPDDFLSVVLTADEEAVVEELRQRWANRMIAYRFASPAWQKTQERMIPFLALDVREISDEFEARRDANGWTYSTASQYWSALLKLHEALEKVVPQCLRAQQKIYCTLKKEEVQRRKTQPLERDSMLKIYEKLVLAGKHSVATLLRVAYELGQRIGDTSKLRLGAVWGMEDPATALQLISLQFREGKTTRSRAPFTLHLSAQEAPWFTTYWERLQTLPNVPMYLFATEAQPADLLDECRDALKAFDPSLCLLSVRRGGLQDMAMQGLSKACLLHHSRHSSEELLDRYLEWGTWNLEAARERYRSTSATEPWRESLYRPNADPSLFQREPLSGPCI